MNDAENRIGGSDTGSDQTASRALEWKSDCERWFERNPGREFQMRPLSDEDLKAVANGRLWSSSRLTSHYKELKRAGSLEVHGPQTAVIRRAGPGRPMAGHSRRLPSVALDAARRASGERGEGNVAYGSARRAGGPQHAAARRDVAGHRQPSPSAAPLTAGRLNLRTFT